MPFIFDRNHYDHVIEKGILNAEKFIWISTANIKDLYVLKGKSSHSLLKDFARLANDGVLIRLLYAKNPGSHFQESFDKLDELITGGIEMQPCARQHSKIIIVDGTMAYAGSANLTGAGLGGKSDGKHNFEAGWLTHDKSEIEEIMDYFDNIWIGNRCDKCGHRGDCEDPIR